MSSSESFQLNWSGFEENASHSFKDLLTDTNFLDVTLASSDHNQVKAHKLILSASSTVFKELLSKNSHQHPIIFMNGIDFDHLNSLVKFIYLGQVEVCQDKLDNFLAVAEELKVKGLFKQQYKVGTNDLISAKACSPSSLPETSSPPQFVAFQQKEELKENENSESESYLFNQEDLDTFNNINTENSAIVNFPSDTFNSLSSVMDIDVSNLDFATLSTFADIKEEENSETYQKIDQKTLQGYSREYIFKCDKCEYRAKKNSNVKRHKLAKHEGISFPCPHCNFPFKYKADLSRHIRTIHEGVKRSQDLQGIHQRPATIITPGLADISQFSNNIPQICLCLNLTVPISLLL